MTFQLALFAVLAIGTVAFVVLPLLRRSDASSVRAEYDLRVYKDQLGEIDRDVERGLLTETQADSARLEIQRRMLTADAEVRSAKTKADRPAMRLGAAIAGVVVVPVGAAVLYAMLGAPGMPDMPFAARQADRIGVETATLDRLQKEADALDAELADNPGDQAGWLRLAARRQQLEQLHVSAKLAEQISSDEGCETPV